MLFLINICGKLNRPEKSESVFVKHKYRFVILSTFECRTSKEVFNELLLHYFPIFRLYEWEKSLTEFPLRWPKRVNFNKSIIFKAQPGHNLVISWATMQIVISWKLDEILCWDLYGWTFFVCACIAISIEFIFIVIP